MSFSTIYGSIDKNVTQFLNDKRFQQVPRTAAILNENEYSYVQKPFQTYAIHFSPSSIIEAILPLKKSTILKLENFLVNIGCIFCDGSNNIEQLDNYNKSLNMLTVIFGKNAHDNDIIGLIFTKSHVSIRINKDGITFNCSKRGEIKINISFSDDFDADFLTALNEIESKIYDLIGFVVNSDFSDTIKTLSIADVVNKALGNRCVTDVKYVDKHDFLSLVKDSGRLNSFDVTTNSIVFSQNDPKLLLDSLNHIFTEKSFDILSQIITVVSNYKTAEGKVEDVDVIFPVDNLFYNNAKEPFVRIILSERYSLSFSTDVIRLYVNDVLYLAREYKDFSEILETILEETSRRVSPDILQKSLI